MEWHDSRQGHTTKKELEAKKWAVLDGLDYSDESFEIVPYPGVPRTFYAPLFRAWESSKGKKKAQRKLGTGER